MARKILIVFVIIVSLGIVLGGVANYWVDRKLPELLSKNNDSPYEITYRNLDVSLLSRSITATDILLVPKSSVGSTDQKPGFYADVKSLRITGFGVFNLLLRDRITAESLSVESGHLTILRDSDEKKHKPIRDEVIEPLRKVIRVSDLALQNTSITLRNLKQEKNTLEIHNTNVNLTGITLSDATLNRKIPFTYKTYSLDCDSLVYRTAVYEIKSGKIETVNDGLKLSSFSLKPHISRDAYSRRLKVEKDLFDVSAKVLAIDKINWGYEDDALYCHVGTVFFDQLNAEIYRDKTVADDPKKKKLYSEQLRDIGFGMTVGLLQVKDSKLAYEEKKDKEDGPGRLTFDRFNLKATGITSGKSASKKQDVKIKIDCRFMNAAPFDVNWSFNVLDTSDSFRIIGHIRDFPSQALIPFTKPYVNAEFEGKLDEVRFDFTGNDNRSAGSFSLEHSDFKVAILTKDGKKKNKLVSAIANLFVKKDSKENPKEVDVKVEREKDKSFFNLLWKSVADGLKQTLL